MYHSLRAGAPVEMEEEETIADALVGGIGGSDNRYTFRMVQGYVDDTVLVSEEEIAGAMAFALERHHIVVEGGGAVGVAALLCRKVERLGQHVVVIISGRNVDTPLLLKIARSHCTTRSEAA
jgi:threonine dehydratase